MYLGRSKETEVIRKVKLRNEKRYKRIKKIAGVKPIKEDSLRLRES